jgi:hypothetical protein
MAKLPGLILPEHLGIDPVGRGAGWRKTNIGLRCSMVLHDLAIREGIEAGELLGGMVESVIAFIQGSTAPSAWREAGAKVAEEIERRMVAR